IPLTFRPVHHLHGYPAILPNDVRQEHHVINAFLEEEVLRGPVVRPKPKRPFGWLNRIFCSGEC
ncbi:MAG: hypothetical protein ACO4B0_16490, partial [bacterium]